MLLMCFEVLSLTATYLYAKMFKLVYCKVYYININSYSAYEVDKLSNFPG
jgi:hypothetical protein